MVVIPMAKSMIVYVRTELCVSVCKSVNDIFTVGFNFPSFVVFRNI